MPVQFLIHDAVMQLVGSTVVLLKLDPEEQKELLGKLYETFKAALAKYETKAERMNRRVNPRRANADD